MAETERKRSTASKKQTVKKVAKKSVAKKATPKTSPRKKSPRTTVSKKTNAVKNKIPAQQVTESEVDLPQNMSLRSIEKSVVLQKEFDHLYRDAMYKIAYVSGLCFLLVGISYISFGKIDDAKLQRAEVIQTNLNSLSTAVDTTAAVPVSEFKFLSDIPKNITAPTTVSFEATHAAEVVVTVTPLGQFNGYSTQLRKISENRYSVTIPGPDKIQAGYFSLRVLVRTTYDHKYTQKSTEFFMGTESIEAWYNDSIGSAISNDSSAESKPNTTNTDDSSTESEVTDSSSDTKTEEITPTDAENIVTKDDIVPTTEGTTFDFKLQTPELTTIKSQTVLNLKTAEELPFVELYARSVNSAVPNFIALGTFRLDRWVFQFDSTNLPSGEYAFFARTKRDGKTITTPSLALTVKNENPASDVQPIKTPETERSFITTADVAPADTGLVVGSAEMETAALLKEHQASFDTLLERYAAAKQGGDESLIRSAKEAITEEQERMVIKATTDVKTKDIADSIEATLAHKVEDLQNRIDTFETLRKERSTGVSATDTDSDGISDIDEITLYKTNPAKADTDGDGFLDGVEIVRGYNPTDATPEATITFESPKESVGLVRDDVLAVEAVPVQVENTNPASTTLSAEIRGRALPNSFVTLYIFSSPTVVTVRADADGAFIYSFDKELEDGRHDIYAAITDNAGEIIAQSSPFSFVKEAQAFTPVAAAEAETVSPVSLATETGRSAYDIAVGVGILAFGLILFMLGISLRRPDTEEMFTEAADKNTNDSSDVV